MSHYVKTLDIKRLYNEEKIYDYHVLLEIPLESNYFFKNTEYKGNIESHIYQRNNYFSISMCNIMNHILIDNLNDDTIKVTKNQYDMLGINRSNNLHSHNVIYRTQTQQQVACIIS